MILGQLRIWARPATYAALLSVLKKLMAKWNKPPCTSIILTMRVSSVLLGRQWRPISLSSGLLGGLWQSWSDPYNWWHRICWEGCYSRGKTKQKGQKRKNKQNFTNDIEFAKRGVTPEVTQNKKGKKEKLTKRLGDILSQRQIVPPAFFGRQIVPDDKMSHFLPMRQIVPATKCPISSPATKCPIDDPT